MGRSLPVGQLYDKINLVLSDQDEKIEYCRIGWKWCNRMNTPIIKPNISLLSLTINPIFSLLVSTSDNSNSLHYISPFIKPLLNIRELFAEGNLLNMSQNLTNVCFVEED